MPAEEGHEREKVSRQGLHVQSHFHVQHIIGEQLMTQQLHPLGLFQGGGDGGGLLWDVRNLQGWDTC